MAIVMRTLLDSGFREDRNRGGKCDFFRERGQKLTVIEGEGERGGGVGGVCAPDS